MKRILFTTILKSQIPFLLLFFISWGNAHAQGYIDCATILNDDESWYNTTPISKNIDGITYLIATPWYNDPPTASFPVINGEAWHGGGDPADGYLAIFDKDCNQILGTHIGGTDTDNAEVLHIDASGNIYVTGTTYSTDFPTTDGSSHSGGSDDVYIRKYAPDGTLLFSTVYGASSGDRVYDIIVDGTDIYVFGATSSTDFPTTNGTTNSGSWDNYVLKYDGNGNLQYATLHGGSGTEQAGAMFVSNGQVIISTESNSSDFPSTDGSTYSGNLDDATMTLLDAGGNVVFSTIYGGDSNENSSRNEIFLHADGTYIYVFASTASTDFPTTDGSTYAGGSETYFRKYDYSGNIIHSKVFEGSGSEFLKSMVVVNGDFYLLANSDSPDYPTTNGTIASGGHDALIRQIDTDGNIIMASLYGGSGNDLTRGFYVDPSGQIFLSMSSSNPPTTDGTTSNWGTVFVKFNQDGTLCAASILDNNPNSNYTTCPYVLNDTIYAVTSHYSEGISTDGTSPIYSEELALTKFVFCPPSPTITVDTLSTDLIMVCENGIIDQVEGMDQVIDGSQFPPIYTDGVIGDQPDIPLEYQWQLSTTGSDPWTDIPGPLAQQRDYTPPPTTTDVYYRRQTKESECCGGALLSTSEIAHVQVSSDVAPTVDGGGTFYTCPGAPVTIDATITGGTGPFMYNWNDGAYTVEDPEVTVTESTVLTLEVTDANGCMQVDQATVITYTAEAGTGGDVCEGAGITIGGSPLSGVPVVPSGDTPPAGEHSIEYTWTPSAGLSCDDCPNPTATPAAAETYTLTVTINYPDGTSCQTNDMVDVGVVAGPTELEFAGRDTVLCFGETTTLGLAAEGVQGPYFAQATGSSTTSGTLNVADLSDGSFTTGVKTNDGTAETVILNLGSTYLVNSIDMSIHSSSSSDSDFRIEVSTDGTNYTTIFTDVRTSSFARTTVSSSSITSLSFPEQNVQYFRFVSESNFRDVGISEFSVKYQPYSYIWTPGGYIGVVNSQANFDAGTLEMPSTNPITYTVTANQGTCNFYDQVTVAVIEARAGEDACGPRYLGEEDRTPGIEETFSWVKITDPGITLGTGDFLGATDILHAPVSASTGGNVGYELTVSYTLPSGVTGICKDTVIVPPLCGEGCDVEPFGGGCPDFDNGTAGLIGYPPNGDDPSLWTTSWTSNLGMVGLDNYTSNTVYLTDNINRTYTVTFTSVLDPTYTCTDVIEANSPLYSTPIINATGGTVCKGDSINIGDPSNNPGLTYEWNNPTYLNDPTANYPKASPPATTEFILTATDNSTGCQVMDTIMVIVPAAANAGPDLNVCDNGVVTIGGNTDTLGFTYSWEPAGAAWEPGSDPADAMPEVFVATTQDFYLTAVDTSGSCTTRDTVTVTVEALPAPFTLSPIDYCPSQASLTLGTSDGTAGGTNEVPSGYLYTWSPNTVSDASAQNPTINIPLPTTSTTYEVTVGTPGGCNQKAEQTINPILSAPLVAGNNTICLGASTSIGDDANETTNTTYAWTSSDTDVNATLDNALAVNPTFTPDVSGSFTFTVTKTNTALSCSSTNQVTITVNEATAPTLSPHTICEGESVQIGTTNNPSLQYQWSPTTDLDDPYIANPTFSGTTNTNYTLTIVDGNGCMAEVSTSVTVNPAPAVTISMPDTVLCDVNTSSIVLNPTVTPAGSYAYSWSPSTNLSNTSALNPTLFVTGEGSFEYIFSLTDQSTGCTITDTLDLVIEFFAPAPIVTANVDTVCIGGDATLSVTVSETNVLYQWQSSTTDCTTGFTDIVDADASTYAAIGISQETYYRVIVTDLTGECRDTSDCVTVSVKSCIVDADLSLMKTVSDATPNVGDTITFTITVGNAGPNDATNVAVEDYLPAGYSDIHNISNSGTQTVDTLFWAGLSVTNGGNITLTFDAVVDAPTGATDEYENVAQVTASDQFDPDSAPDNGVDPDNDGLIGTTDTGSNDGSVDTDSDDDSDNEPVSVMSADLSLMKTVSDATPNVGDTITFTITVANAGPNDATNVAVEDYLPVGYSDIHNISNSGTQTVDTLFWAGLSVTNGGNITLTFDAVVDAPTGATDEYENVAQVTASDQFDPDSAPDNGVDPDNDGLIGTTDTGSNDGSVDTDSDDDSDNEPVSVMSADLSLMKTVSDATPNVGDTITFTITVANAGPNDATNVAVEDYLPVGYSDIHNISNSGTQTVDTLFWAGLSVTNGGNITLTFDAVVNAPTGATDEYENVAQVTASDQFDPDSAPDNGVDPDNDGLIGTTDTGSNDGSVDTDSDDDSDNEPVSVMSADLSLMKTVSDATPNVGDTITFTITVGNAGPNDATNVAVEDYLPAGYSDIHNISNSGTQTVDTLFWAGLSVTNGGNITLTFDAVVNAPTGATDEYENVAQVTASDQFDPDSAPDNGVDPDNDGLIGTVDTGSNDGSVDTDSDDDSDNEPVSVMSADLSLMKTVSDATPNVGDTITFTITVANAGPNDATNVAVEDYLPAGYSDIHNMNNSGTQTVDTLFWAGLSVTNGGNITLTFDAVVNAPTGATDEYENVAQVTASDQFDPDSAPDNGVDPDNDGLIGTTDTGSNDGSVDTDSDDDSDNEPVSVMSADLSLMKTVSDATPNVGDTITFTITVANAGPNDATNVAVEDYLPAGYSDIHNISNSGTQTVDTLFWAGLSVTNGGNITLTFDAVVNAPTGATDEYENVAQVTASDQFDPDSAPDNGVDPDNDGLIGTTDTGSNDGSVDTDSDDDSDNEPVSVMSADLSLMKTVSDATPNVGDTITFTITVANAGPNDATNVAVEDYLPAGYSDIHNISNSGTQTVDTLFWAGLSVTNGGNITLTFDAVVNAPTGATDEYENVAQVTASDQFDPDSAPDNGVDPDNDGLIGTTDTGSNDGSVDTDSDDDSDNEPVSVMSADLSLMKTVSDATPNVGDTITFTITVANAGPNDATNVAVEDYLPAGYSDIHNISNSGTQTVDTLFWAGLSVTNGGNITLTFDAVVNAPTGATDEYENVAQVTASDQFDPDSAPDNGVDPDNDGLIGTTDTGSNDGSVDTDSDDDSDNEPVSVMSADLSLMKTVSDATPNVGDTITFTITVANAGPNDATNVAVEDYLPAGYSDIHNISNSGTQTVDTLFWAGLSVTNGGNITLTFDAVVDAPTGATDEYENVAQVTASDQFDPDSAPDNGVDPDNDGLIGTTDTGSNDGSVDTDSDDDSDNEPVAPMGADLSLLKTVSDTMPFVGDTITYTITVANAGPNDATNVAVEDYLPVGYSDIHNISDAGTQTVDTLYWSGLSITNGANITLTFDVVVDAPTGATDEYENVAQVTASDQYDSDSSPDNGVDPDGDGLIGTVDTGSNDGSVDTDSDDDSDNEPVIVCTYTITARDTSVCAGQPIDLSTLVNGSPQGTLEYGTDFSYGGNNMVNPLTSTTYFVRDSNTTNMCVDTALIFVQVDTCDWGDLPDISATTNAGDYQTSDANNGPVHIIDPAITLGNTIDAETDGQPSTDALGDGTDEDGLLIFESLNLSPGNTFRLPLSYTNTTGSPAHIEAWIDWNNNGEFDSGEMVLDVTDPSSGLYDRLEVTVPTDVVTGEYLGLRIRISNQDNMTPYGLISEGEVEDYLIGIECPTQICVPIEITIRK